MFSLPTPRCVPRSSTAGPALRPKSHPRPKLINSRVMGAGPLFILILSEFDPTSVSGANHDPVSHNFSSFFGKLLFIGVGHPCRMLMHAFIRFGLWKTLLIFLLSDAGFMGVSVLKTQNDKFIKDFLCSWHPATMSNLSIKPKSALIVSFLKLAKVSEVNVKATVIRGLLSISNDLSIWENGEDVVAHVIERVNVFIFRMTRVVVMKVTLVASSDVDFESALIPVRVKFWKRVSGVFRQVVLLTRLFLLLSFLFLIKFKVIVTTILSRF